jgi:chromosome segregation ATPase
MEAAADVDALIKALPEALTDANFESSFEAYETTKAAYDLLTTAQKGYIADEEMTKLAGYLFELTAFVTDKIDSAEQFEKINGANKAAAERLITNVTAYLILLDDATIDTEKIETLGAKIAAYNKDATDYALSREVRALLGALSSDYAAITAENLADAKAAAAAAKNAYDALTADVSQWVDNSGEIEALDGRIAAFEQAEQTVKENAEKARAVTDKIDAIGAVDKNSADKIREARSAYDALTDEQKTLVENYQTLTDAEAAFSELGGGGCGSSVGITFYSIAAGLILLLFAVMIRKRRGGRV